MLCVLGALCANDCVETATLDGNDPLDGHPADCVPGPGATVGLGSGLGVTTGGVVELPPPPPPQAVNVSDNAAIAAMATDRTNMRFTFALFPALGDLTTLSLQRVPQQSKRCYGRAPLNCSAIADEIELHGARAA